MIYFTILGSCLLIGALSQVIVEEPAISTVTNVVLPVPGPIIGNRLMEFSSSFVQAVQQSQTLLNDLSWSMNEINDRDNFFRVIYNAAVHFGNPKPAELANILVDTVRSVRDVLEPIRFSKILSTAVGRTLDDYGLLSFTQAAELGRTFARITEVTVAENNAMPQPGQHIKAIADGVYDFMDTLRLNSPRTALVFMYHLIEELYSARIYM